MTNFLPTLISKLPSVMQEIAVDSLIVATGVTQEQLTAAVDAAVESTTQSIYGDMGMLWMLLSGILVFFMQAGFTLVESGMTRSKKCSKYCNEKYPRYLCWIFNLLVSWILFNVW